MYNKISVLALALLATGSGIALPELTPGENIIQQEAAQAAQHANNNKPCYRFISTHFGKINSTLQENRETNHKKLELLVKQRVFDYATIAAPAIAVIAFVVSVIGEHHAGNLVAGFCLGNILFDYRENKTQTDSIFYKYAHDTRINLEKDLHGNWTVVNSVYNEEVNEHLAQAAAAIERDDVLNAQVFAKLEKIFVNQRS